MDADPDLSGTQIDAKKSSIELLDANGRNIQAIINMKDNYDNIIHLKNDKLPAQFRDMFAVQLKNKQNQDLRVDRMTVDLMHNGSVILQFTTDHAGPCNISIFYNKVLIDNKINLITTSLQGTLKNSTKTFLTARIKHVQVDFSRLSCKLYFWVSWLQRAFTTSKPNLRCLLAPIIR